MAPTYILALATFLGGILSRQGVVIETDSLVTTLTTLVTVAGPLVIMARQYMTGRSTAVGTRPKA